MSSVSRINYHRNLEKKFKLLMQFHVYLDIFIAMIIYLFELDILT